MSESLHSKLPKFETVQHERRHEISYKTTEDTMKQLTARGSSATFRDFAEQAQELISIHHSSKHIC